MKKIAIFIALMCLVGALAGQYNDMIGETYNTREWPGRISVYAENGNYYFQYNIPDEFQFVAVTPNNKLIKSFDFKAGNVEGVMYLKIQNSDGSWSKGKEFPITFRDNQFIVSEVIFDEIFGTRNEVTVSFVWEFKQGHNLVDHSPFAIKGESFQAKLKRNGDVILKGSPT
jgi:hypothetical protein